MSNSQIMNCPGFIIQMPSSWRRSLDTSDADTIQITIDDTDSFTINMRKKSKDIKSYQTLLVENVCIVETVDEENGGQILDETTFKDSQVWESDIFPDIIEGLNVQCLIPKESGRGAIGVFFESSDSMNDQQFPFSFLGLNLKPENEKIFMEVVRTLKFNSK